MIHSNQRRCWHVFPGALALALVVLATACGEDPVEPPPVPTTVTISPETAALVSLGESVQLTATVRDQHGQVMTGVSVTWWSRDASVVTVSSGGLVTAEGNGTAVVEASAGNAVGTAEMTTQQEPAEVRVSPLAEPLVALGDTARLTAEALDANGHAIEGAEFTWSSGDETVATVEGTGLVTAVANGSTSIMAAVEDVSGSAEVTVEQPPVEVRVTPPADTLVALGDTVRLLAEALDANGNGLPGAEFAWSSADEMVVTVDGMGLVVAVSNGSAEVAASFGETVGGTTVTVSQRAVEMRLWPLADTLLVTDTVRLLAEASDANGHVLANAEFAWSSGDVAVAAVDADGLVTGLKGGSVAVMVTEAASMLSDAAQLLVVAPREELVELYEALGGLGWTNNDNWGTDAPLDEWYGVTTGEDGRITELDLSSNGLKGEIPGELALIESLEVLDLSGNGVGGGAADASAMDAVPPGWRGLPAGEEELFAQGWISDELPGRGVAAMARSTRHPSASASARPDTCESPSFPMSELGEGLTYTIPRELGGLPNLRFLDLSDNSLVG